MSQHFGRWQPALWGSGQIAVQIFRDVPSLLLLYYLTQVLAVPAITAGVAIFLPKLLWGVLCDFGIGSVLDRTSSRFQRRYFLLIGAVIAPVALILLFSPFTATNTSAQAVHVSLLLSLYMACFSAFSVPHLAIGTELSTDGDTQSRIMAWRTAFIGVGLLGGAALAPFLVQRFGGGVSGYQGMSYVLATLCSVTLVLAFFGSNEDPKSGAVTLRTGSKFASVLANRPFVFLFLAYFAQLVGQGSAYATLAYVVTFKLGFKDPLQVLSLSVLVTGSVFVLIQPVLVRIVRKVGTRRTFIVGSVLYALSLIWIAFGPAGSTASLVGASFALGLTNASTFQSIFTRLSAVISSETSGRLGVPSQAGLYASLFVINDKVAFALGGTLLAGSILSLFEFVPGGTLVQPPSALLGITLAFAGVPLLANTVAIVLMAVSPEPQLSRFDSEGAPRSSDARFPPVENLPANV